MHARPPAQIVAQGQLEPAATSPPADEPLRGRSHARRVEAGLQRADEFAFANDRCGLVRAFVPSDAFDARKEAAHFAWQPVRCSRAMAGEAAPKVLRLAHIKHAVPDRAHQIDARALWRRPEEVRAKPGRQRAGRREQQQLGVSDVHTLKYFFEGISPQLVEFVINGSLNLTLL